MTRLARAVAHALGWHVPGCTGVCRGDERRWFSW